MESAPSVSRAALTVTALLFFTVLFAAVSAADQTTPTSAASKKKTSKTVVIVRTPARTSKTVFASKGHARSSVFREEAAGGTKRVSGRKVIITRKLVHGHWVRTAQIIHVRPPAPTYQTHPDPERYQQIQQALASNGYFKGEVNGQWDNDSVMALKQFQTDHQLVNDGKISSLSLIDLGLGPNREITAKPTAKDTADTIPASVPPASADPAHD